LSPKTGVIVGQQFGGWNHIVYTASPGIPGDSGSAYMSSNGGALGVLSTIQVAPVAGSNGVSDLGRALAYMKMHTNLDAVTLATGTETFSGLL
ncbi:MAG TPA: serine protease, partial [Actinomycetota bacterium]|nr:serine protease [Actinomycetota bacterium]